MTGTVLLVFGWVVATGVVTELGAAPAADVAAPGSPEVGWTDALVVVEAVLAELPPKRFWNAEKPASDNCCWNVEDDGGCCVVPN